MSTEDRLLIQVPRVAVAGPRVEITRSFSYKLNVGNYESRDFFCSQKAECALEDAALTAEALHAFCRAQVMQAVREYRENAAAEDRKVQTRIEQLRRTGT